MSRLPAALELVAKRGWAIFPVEFGTKKPLKSAKYSNGKRWGQTSNEDEIRVDFTRWPQANIGIPTGPDNGIFVVEADTVRGHGVDGLAALQALEAAKSPLPTTLMAESPSGSLHRYYKHPGNGTKVTSTALKGVQGVDVKGDGGMVVGPPSARADGTYRWLNDLPIADAPTWLIELVIERRSEQEPQEPTEKQAPLYRVIAAVAVIPNDDLDWDSWNKRGLAIWAATGGSNEGSEIFDTYSRKSHKYDEAATAAKWAVIHSSPPDQIGAGSVFHWATEACPRWEILAFERPGTIAAQMQQVSEIAGLALLPDIVYEQARREVAERLNIRVSALDEIVERLRPARAIDEDAQGSAITFDPIEPWACSVDGAALIKDMKEAIKKYVVMSDHQLLTVALWIMQAHAFYIAEHTPRLQIRSPTPRCGKTTVLKVIKPMVPKPLGTENITTAALFRVIEKFQPTLLIDEADSFLKRADGSDNEELRGILNAGHGRDGAVIRTVGDGHEVRGFKVFAPIAYAWLVRRGKGKHVSETLEDRSITIELRRRKREEAITRFRTTRASRELAILGRRIARWIADNLNTLADEDPLLPDELGDRAQDNWRLMIAIADTISKTVGEEARTAALAIANENLGESDDDMALLALGDVAAIIKGKGRMKTAEILAQMRVLGERPWRTWGKDQQALAAHGLAKLLKPFGIRPKQIRFEPKPALVAKGYLEKPIQDAAERFIDPHPEPTVEDDVEPPSMPTDEDPF
jgi:hypothetical protein